MTLARAHGLAVILALLAPSTALAHSLDFGVLRVRAIGGGAELVLRAAGHEGTPPDVTLATEGPCALTASPRRAVNADRVEVRVRCDGALEDTVIRVEGMDEALSVIAVVDRADGGVDRAVLTATSPSLTVGARPAPGQTFARYLRLGAEHLATGLDHLLFLLALALLVARGARRTERPAARALLVAITGFTLGHSLTLALRVLAGASLPSAPVEACVALSIVLLASELARPPRDTLTQRYPGAVAAALGLVHGLGFAGALGELGWPEGGALEALAGFNLGLEAAQLAAVAAAYPLVRLLVAREAERVPAYAIGAIAAAWTIERLAALGA